MCYMGFLWVFSHLQKHVCKWPSYPRLPIVVNACALQWTGDPFRAWLHLTPKVSGIGSGFYVAFAMIKQLHDLMNA